MGTWMDPYAIDVPMLPAAQLDLSCEGIVLDDDGTEQPCEEPATGWRLDPEELLWRDSLWPYPACLVHE